MIRLSAKKEIQLVELKSEYSNEFLQEGKWQDAILYARRLKNSHEEGIKGIRVMPDLKGFMTWSGGGLMRIWNSDADCLSQFRVPFQDTKPGEYPIIDAAYEEGVKNQLAAVACVANGKVLIAGDRFGMVRLIDTETEKVIQMFYAHGSEIVDIAYCKTGDSTNEREVFITSSRDRTVQIFSLNCGSGDKSWRLLQTLATHKSSVIKVLISKDGQRIVSCSSDRTIVVHQAVTTQNDSGESQIVAYAPEKTISLRAAPRDIFLDEDASATSLVVACSDRYIYNYRFPTGELVSSYKSVDRKGDSLVLHDVSIIRVPSLTNEAGRKRSKQAYLVGIGNDKSIRVYEHPSGVHIGSEWGHSEGVSGLELLKNTTDTTGPGNNEWVMASSGNDGCVFLWSLKGLDSDKNNWGISRVADETSGVARSSPARKIISKVDLARLMGKQVPESRASPGKGAVNVTTPASPQTPSQPLTVTKTRSLRHSMSTLSLGSKSSTPTLDPKKKTVDRRSGSLATTPIPRNNSPKNSTPQPVHKLKPSTSLNALSRVSPSSAKHTRLSNSRSLTELANVSNDYTLPKSDDVKKPYGTLRKQRSSRTSMLATIPSASMTAKVTKSPAGASIYSTDTTDLTSTRQKKYGASSVMQKSASRRSTITPLSKATKRDEHDNSMSGAVSPTSIFSQRSSTTSPVTPTETTTSSGASAATSSTLKAPPTITTTINALCSGLTQFRDQYRHTKKGTAPELSKSNQEQEAVERLKREMKQTLVLLEGTLRERAKVDELVGLFGDRLVEMISSKIN